MTLITDNTIHFELLPLDDLDPFVPFTIMPPNEPDFPSQQVFVKLSPHEVMVLDGQLRKLDIMDGGDYVDLEDGVIGSNTVAYPCIITGMSLLHYTI